MACIVLIGVMIIIGIVWVGITMARNSGRCDLDN